MNYGLLIIHINLLLILLLLILDQGNTHYTDDLKEIFEKYNSKNVFIPKGCTSYNKPLDKCINKSFKDNLHNLYNKYLIENYNNKSTNEHLIG